MKKTITAIIVVLLISTVPVLAEEKKETTSIEKNIALPVFKPKNLGAPKCGSVAVVADRCHRILNCTCSHPNS